MEAVLSPTRNSGLILDRGSVRALVTSEGVETMHAPARFAARWLREVRDAIFLEAVTTEEAQRQLRREVHLEQAFRLMLPLLDVSLGDEVRLEAAREIQQLAPKSHLIFNWLGARYYAAPFPEVARLENAIALTRSAGVDPLRGFLLSLHKRQPLIREVWEAWNQIPIFEFPADDPEAARRHFVVSGIFFRLVDLLAVGGSVAGFLRIELDDPQNARTPQFQRIMRGLTQPFYARQHDLYLPPDQRKELLVGIEQWKSQIFGLIRLRHYKRANEEAENLIAYQLAHGHPSYAAMSMCDLAAQGKEINDVRAQSLFAELAVRTNPWDFQCWNQFADSYKSASQPNKSLEIYEDVLCEHPRDVVARNGRAEVLRDLGQLDAALAAYEETMLAHPRDAVARNGRAEVLRDLGQLDAALAAYEETMLAHPRDAVARNGRAEVLRDLGQLDAALVAYDAVIEEHPHNAVARNGRAEVLRDLGQLDAALAAYEETMLAHPRDAVARNGRAEVLRDLGQFDAALVTYDAVIEEYPRDVVASCGRAEVLRDLGQLDAALAAYDVVIKEHPRNAVARNGRAEVLRDLGQLDAALVAYEETMRAHPRDAVAHRGLANLLARKGKFADALRLLPTEPPRSKGDWITQHIRGMILLQRGEVNAARAIFETGIRGKASYQSRGYFETAYALCCLLSNRPAEVLAHLNIATNKRLRDAQAILRSHAYGELGNLEECEEVLAPLKLELSDKIQALAAEIDARYLQKVPLYNEQWLFKRETELLTEA